VKRYEKYGKGNLKCEMIWTVWKKGKTNSYKIWTIWKNAKLNIENI
jgi:hypothetical protein